jgi:hypothetical protein
MDIPENNNKKIILISAAVVIIALILIVVVWKSKTNKGDQTQGQTPKEITGISGSDGKTPSASSETPKLKALDEVTSIFGKVEKIEGKTLTVKAFFFGDQKTYTVTVGGATKIKKKEAKKELPKSEEGKPIEPFAYTDAGFSDIRQNDNVSIDASENIRDKTDFEAKTIFIEIVDHPAPPTSVEMPSSSVIPQNPK